MWSEYFSQYNRLDAVRIGIALVVSLILHTLWFGIVDVHLPKLIDSDVPLSVRLIKMPLNSTETKHNPNTNSTPKTNNKNKEKAINSKNELNQISPSLLDTSEKQKETGDQSAPKVKEDGHTELSSISVEKEISAMPDTIASTNSVASSKSTVLSDETTTPDGITLPQEPQLPNDAEKLPPYRKVNLLFDVIRGPQNGRIGTASIEFQSQPELGTYFIKSVMEPDFIASLIVRGSLIQISEGKITEKGLQPNRYEYKFGDFKDKHYVAEFNWSDFLVIMKTSKGEKTATIPFGTQDLLSFLLQFMFVPPLEDMHIALTTGRKFKEYHYQFVGEESLNLKSGQFRSIHIVNTSLDEKERTELWLAIDYNYLPVKISKTEKDGAITEQVLTDFNSSY